MELDKLLYRLTKNNITLSSVNGKPFLYPDQIRLTDEEMALLDIHLHGNHNDIKLIGNAFKMIATNHPKKVAVYYNSTFSTYKELDISSDLVANYLQRLKLQKGDVVAVCLPKSINLIAVILGIFKAGITYLPLDEKLPADRMTYMLSDSKAKCIIQDIDVFGHLNSVDSIKKVSIDQVFGNKEFIEYTDLSTPKPGDSAYLIYTSGSTGKPKGVEISQLAIAEHIHQASELYGITSEDRILQFSNFSFDPSIEQVFCTLTNGALLYLASDDVLHSDLLIDFLVEHNITYLNTSPGFAESIFPAVFNEQAIVDQLRLNTLVVGGEAVNTKFCIDWATSQLNEKCNLLNAYGPTEATITSTVYKIPSDFDNAQIPVGKPIKGTKAFVVDTSASLIENGLQGELYISGSRLASGYLGLSDQTNAQFVYPEFAKGEKCYKTGDLVSWTNDGNLLFHGRVDKQVKVRGYRIEPEEIEVIINNFDGISKSRVLPHNISTGTQLVAFLKSTQKIDIGVLRQDLSKKLPDYMIPVQFKIVDEFPLTLNGKIADNLLIAQLAQVEQIRTYELPATNIEIALSQIWEDVLQVNKIGINDDFFELGGHSIAAIRIISQIRRVIKKQIALPVFYNNPTIKLLSENLEHIDDGNLPVAKREYDGLLDVSPAQKGLWLQLQLGYLKAYHITGFYSTGTKIDAEVLQLAINALVDQHETLRTSFEDKLGRPFQKINNHSEVELKVFDQSINDQLIQSFTDERFNFSSDSLIRFALYGHLEEESIIGVVIHHLIADGWSMNTMLNELIQNYERIQQGKKLIKDVKRLQYTDYVLWQSEDSHKVETSLNYWKSNLEGFQYLNLPADYSANKQNSEKGSFHKITLDKKVSDSIRVYAKGQKNTPFSICFSAIYVLLSKFCNQQDICIGLPVANRNNTQLEDMLGFFVNSLVIRINPENELISFCDLTKLVSRTIMNAQGHQNVSFDQLVKSLKPERNGIKNPFFNVQVNYVPQANTLIKGEQIVLERIPHHNKTAKFDLTFDFEENETGDISLGIEYNLTLFSQKTIELLLGSLEAIITHAVVKPEEKVSLLSLSKNPLTNIKDEQAYNVTAITELCLHQLVEEQAKISPDRNALKHGTIEINYKTLNERVAFLAGVISEKGVKRGDVVTVLMNRSIEMVIAFLGIMKAGAAYMPVSKDLPADRIAYMIKNSKSQYLIGSREDVSEIGHLLIDTGLSSIKTILLDKDTFSQKHSNNFETNVEINKQDIAYVLYTSGSTGRPKGVMISHEAIVNHMCWMKEEFPWKSNDVFIQKTAVTFDASVWEFYLPLIMGNQLILSEGGDQTDPVGLINEIQNHNVTVLQGTPTLLEYLNKQQAFINSSSLKWIFSGGEALKVSVAASIKENQGVRLINLYGPTECTIDATFYEYDEELVQEVMPIGKPISNMFPMILDSHQNPLPDGFVGELCFAGVGVATGYINQPDLTDKSFISSNEFYKGRYYKTGDLAKIDEKGFIHYIGRKDHQLKIRGIRIEAGEIESALNSMEGISQVGVVVSDNILIAYIEAAGEMDLLGLKNHAAQKLPVYMIPGLFVQLDKLPETTGGKLDRRKLQQLEVPTRTTEIIPPKNDIEKQVLNIWLKVFGQDRISVEDNFFEIGGHSLIGMQIISQIKNEMMFNIPLKDLFEKSSIRALSNLINSEGIALETETEEDIISSFGEDSQELII